MDKIVNVVKAYLHVIITWLKINFTSDGARDAIIFSSLIIIVGLILGAIYFLLAVLGVTKPGLLLVIIIGLFVLMWYRFSQQDGDL